MGEVISFVPTEEMFSVATEKIYSVATEEISSVAAEEISSVATEEISSVPRVWRNGCGMAKEWLEEIIKIKKIMQTWNSRR